jgi:cytoskeletal protein CcmA (bactofilin family)
MAQTKEMSGRAGMQDSLDNWVLGESTCVVTAGTKLHGDVNCETDLRLDGSIEGELVVQKRVVVGVEGFIKGNIRANHMVIHGEIEGDLKIEGDVFLGSKAKIVGNISSSRMMMEEGACFTGTLSVGEKK